MTVSAPDRSSAGSRPTPRRRSRCGLRPRARRAPPRARRRCRRASRPACRPFRLRGCGVLEQPRRSGRSVVRLRLERLADRRRREPAVLGAHGARDHPGERGHAGQLVLDHVAALVGHDLLAWLGPNTRIPIALPIRCPRGRRAPPRNPSTRAASSWQPLTVGPHRTRRRRPRPPPPRAHRRCRLRDGVGAEVDRNQGRSSWGPFGACRQAQQASAGKNPTARRAAPSTQETGRLERGVPGHRAARIACSRRPGTIRR